MDIPEKNQERNDLIRAFFYPLVFVALMWIVKLLEFIFHWSFSAYGILPRSFSHLPAILTMPFLHADFAHLLSNTGPVFILSGFVFYFYRQIAWRVIMWIYVLSGFWLWLGGREAFHIGASAMVYGFAAFLFFSGIFKRNTALMTVTLVITFLYGSLVWGFFPEFFPQENISWEGHLFGFIAGLLMAVYYRNQGPESTKYHWDEDEDEDDENAYWKTEQPSDKNALDPNARPTFIRRH